MQLSGDFANINFATLLNLSLNSKLNGRMTITQGIEIAQVYLQDGLAVYATLGVLIGIDAILEIFLWKDAKFFFEEGLGNIEFPLRINMDTASIIQTGVEYVKRRVFLDEIGITVNSVLIPTSQAYNLLSDSNDALLKFVIAKLNGINNIAQAFEELNLSLAQLIDLLYNLISQKLVVAIDPSENSQAFNSETLPPWVNEKLSEINPNINQAVIDLIIWSDRAKDILINIEKDLKLTIDDLSKSLEIDNVSNDEGLESVLDLDSNTLGQPLFGEFGQPG